MDQSILYKILLSCVTKRDMLVKGLIDQALIVIGHTSFFEAKNNFIIVLRVCCRSIV